MRLRLLRFAFVWPVALSAQAPLSRGFSVGPEVSLRIWVPEGSVRVEAWDRDSVRVVGSLGKGSRFVGSGGTQHASLVVESVDSKAMPLAHGELVVTVPRKALVWIKLAQGAVVASGTAGELKAITVSGTVTVSEAQGTVSVETIDAAVSITSVRGEVHVRGGSGRVQLSGINGTATTATVNGAVELRGDSLGSASLETIGGSIQVWGALEHSALIGLESHSGSITLHLNSKALPSLALTSRGGTVTNALGRGEGKAGHIVAHSFRGSIIVLPIAATVLR